MFYVKAAGAAFVLLVLWGAIVVGGALYGWWRDPLAPPGDAGAFLAALEARVATGSRGDTALVLIENGRIFGERYSSAARAVNGDTTFAVASVSKWVAAWGVMRLVQEGRLDLDRPVGDYLTRWKLPESGYDNRQVTVRRLLSHTAGLTDGLGFGDYGPDERPPDVVASLEQPRASSNRPVAIAVGRDPGSAWQYSGGGYLIIELLVEEVAGAPFDVYMHETVFRPLGMSRSSYRYLAEVENAAASYDEDGRPAPVFRYASKAATGLVTSARDMAHFAMAQLPADVERPLTQDIINRMRSPHGFVLGQPFWGLGTVLYAPTASGDFVFGHDGSNEPAISASVRVNPDSGDAIVVLATGSASLAPTLAFHWVFWQTGLPDPFGLGNEVAAVMPVLLAGALLIVLASILVGWWLRRRRRG